MLVNAVMSGTDGFTLASWINNNRDLAGSVILMISGVDRQEMAQRCEQVKAIYVEKPGVAGRSAGRPCQGHWR